MEQATNYFNSGKYKEAFSHLNSNALNIQSYEPNLAICQYLLSRTNNSSQVCLKKLAQLLNKKVKKDKDHYEALTQQLIKYNIGVLMHLNGRKQNAQIILNDIYMHEKCLIDVMKSRILILLMELKLNTKNPVEVVELSIKYLQNLNETKSPPPIWISLIFHEHLRSFAILKEEIDFIFGTLISQAMIQLGVSPTCLPFEEQRQANRQEIIENIKKRKNNVNKYHEISFLMMDRFYEAHRDFDNKNYQKALQLMNFAMIQRKYKQMPQTKIITNIYSGLANNNSAIIYYSVGKRDIALNHFYKANTLLSKGCTGVEDKDLQLFSSNYSNVGYKIAYNIGLISLISKSTEAFQIFEFFKKNNYLSSDYKYWYRIGQAEVEYYHENYSKLASEERQKILESALNCFTNSLYVIEKKSPATISLKGLHPILQEEEIQRIELAFKAEKQSYSNNTIVIICYISLLLGRYYKVIMHAKELLRKPTTPDSLRIYIIQYMVVAYTKLNRLKDANKVWNDSEKLMKSNRKTIMKAGYFKRKQLIKQEMQLQRLGLHQATTLKIKQGSLNDAYKILKAEKQTKNRLESRGILQGYLEVKKATKII